MRLRDFPVLSFDTYGTLIDWETGIWEALQPLLSRLADPPGREDALAAFAREESACQAANPGLLYADLLAAVHQGLARRWGAEPDRGESHRFGQSVGDWPANSCSPGWPPTSAPARRASCTWPRASSTTTCRPRRWA